MKLLYSLSAIASVGIAAAEVSPRLTSGAEFTAKEFDYVLVGGGTAGLTIAARLSEDPETTVGVIEAGDYFPDDPLINTPSLGLALSGNATYDWLFKSVPQVNVSKRAIDLPRGKMLGGSSGINGMVFDRGSKSEYDAWAKLGNSGWDWNGLLPSMKAAERFTGVDPFRENHTNAEPDIFPSQGQDGLVAASYNSWYGDTTLPFAKSMANLGIPINFNPDSGNAYGVFNSATSINRTTGLRSYSANTYYAYNAHRPNLVVLTGAQATKINFDSKNKTKSGGLVATGVSFVHKSQTYTVKVKKEVILSAGTFQSPQLLELSGIGNSTILKKNGIEVLIDLPTVGENHQDHFIVSTTYELKPGSSTQNFDSLRNNATFAAAAAAQYDETRDGIMSSTLSILSFITMEPMATATEITNMKARFEQEVASEKLTPLQKASYKIQKGWLNEKVGLVEIIAYPGYGGPGVPKTNATYLTLLMVMQHPFSRGNTHINSSDPLAPPQIDPRCLSKSIDLETLVYSVKFGQKLSKTEPLASIVVTRQDPAPDVTSDAAISEYIKANIGSSHHSIGTVALAPKEHGGVVDTKLKVYGTANVRVADASIMPLHIGSHTQRTVYGIGEKAAKIIKST